MGVILENRELEAAIAGCLLLDNRLADRLQDLSPEDFAGHAERMAYEAILAMVESGQAVDYQSLEAELARRGQLQQVGGAAWIASLTDHVASIASLQTYADQVRELARARRLRARLCATVQAIDKGSPSQEAASAILDGVTEAMSGRDMCPRATLSDALTAIEDRVEGRSKPYLGMGLGPALNAYAPGPGDLLTVGARTSVGKSALLIALAEQQAIMGARAMIVSLEMTGIQIQHRRVAAESGVPLTVVSGREGCLPTEDEWARLAAAFGRLNSRRLVVQYGPRGLSGILSAVRSEHAREPLTLAIVDHLGRVRLPRADRHDLALGKATTALADLASDLGIVIALGCQLSRLSDREGNEGIPREPRLSDLRDSGNIEQDSGCVWLLHRTDHLQDYPPKIHDLNVMCAKTRNGPTGRVVLDYEPATQQIRPADTTRERTEHAPARKTRSKRFSGWGKNGNDHGREAEAHEAPGDPEP